MMMETEKIDVPKFEGFEAFYGLPVEHDDCYVLGAEGAHLVHRDEIASSDYQSTLQWAQICYRKIKPKRIVLEETDHVRQAEYGDWYEHEGIISQWKGGKTSHEYKIWRQVEEQS